MFDFHPDMETLPRAERILASNSPLMDNSVYSFAPSRRKLLWIGTESGLNYYSYSQKRIQEFPVMADGKMVKYVHSVRETNDSTLWVVSAGEGIVKIILDATSLLPKVKSARRFTLDGGKRNSNYFFVSFQENDSVIWFGNRGYGAYKMNTHTNQLTPCRIDDVVKNQTVNDIFAIHKNDEGYWFGTSFGLTRLYQGEYRVYNETDGFPNNTIHGILEGRDNNLWLSTNQGLVRFNVRENTVQTYRQQGDLEVIEFSDGAFFKDQQTGTLFLVVRTDSLRLARMINFRKNTCLLCISTASLFLVKSAIFMIFCKALRSKKLWCWTIVRTSLTFHLLLSITLTGTIILTLIR